MLARMLLLALLPVTVATAAPLISECSYDTLNYRVKMRFGDNACLWRARCAIGEGDVVPIHDGVQIRYSRTVGGDDRWQIWCWFECLTFDDLPNERPGFQRSLVEICLGDGATFEKAFDMASRRVVHFPLEFKNVVPRQPPQKPEPIPAPAAP